ncbi:MAG: hypothetical protein DRP60_11270 [Spirochaetes bacterium]|nr:MAG: hypothetical protein DRP60_11270 [Spirochaetota bacterium]
MSANKSSGKKKKKKDDQEVPIESMKVTLKPVFGIQPRSYLPVIWGLIIILIIFLLLFLPGIKHNGTFLTVQTLPSDASVIVDGIRLGTSGDEVFVPQGKRSLTLRRPGFVQSEQNIDVSGKIFASRLFPLKVKLTVILEPEKGYDFMAAGVRDFAHWSATGPQEGRYAIPPVLTRMARDILTSDFNGESPGVKLTEAALPLSIDERQLSDIFRAQFMHHSHGAPAGLESIVSFINSAALDSFDNPGNYFPALSLVNDKHLEQWDLNSTAENKKTAAAYLAEVAEDNYSNALSTLSFPALLLGGRKFITIPKTTFPIGDMEALSSGYNPRSGALPVIASMDTYYISAVEISNKEFSSFIAENPRWSVENREKLTADNLADDNYLSDWSLSGYPTGTAGNPVTDVSWYAAAAYAEWFSNKYLKGSGLTARLPREDEWEAAARLNRAAENTSELSDFISTVDSADRGTLGIIGMAGNVREWALNPFRVNENLFRPEDGTPSYQDPSDTLAAPDRPVRGGAFIDSNLPYPAAVRGGLPPETTSPVIGFRLVAAVDL